MAALGVLIGGAGLILLYAGIRDVGVIATFQAVLSGQAPPAGSSGAGSGANTPPPGFSNNNAPITPYTLQPGENTSPNPGFGTVYPSLLTPGTNIGS